jgi:hypothetical protein
MKTFLIYLCNLFLIYSQPPPIVGRFGSRLLDAAYIADYETISIFLSKGSDSVLDNEAPINVNDEDRDYR